MRYNYLCQNSQNICLKNFYIPESHRFQLLITTYKSIFIDYYYINWIKKAKLINIYVYFLII
jgi:hypothetical protein